MKHQIQDIFSRHTIRQAFGSMPYLINISTESIFHINMNIGKSKEGKGKEKMDEVVQGSKRKNLDFPLIIYLKFCSVHA